MQHRVLSVFKPQLRYRIVLKIRPAQYTTCKNSVSFRNWSGPRELSQLKKILQHPDFGYCSRISFKLQQNKWILRPTANLCWSIWPFKLSELCRPVSNQERGQRCWHFDCAGYSRLYLLSPRAEDVLQAAKTIKHQCFLLKGTTNKL